MEHDAAADVDHVPVELVRVRDDDVALRRRDLELERHFESGFVEARHHPARVGRLELRERVVEVVLAHAVEARELARDGRGVRDAELGAARGERLREDEDELVGRLAAVGQAHVGGRGDVRAVLRRLGAQDGELAPVEHDRARDARHVDRDRDVTGEALLRRIDDERDVVADGPHRGR